MIDEKALIKIYKEKAYVESRQEGVITYEGGIHTDGFVSGVLWAIEVAKAQQKVGEWIPVSERLPEEGKYILLSFENFTVPTIGRYEEDAEGGAFYVGDDDETCVQQDLFVNSWMPLPEPWEGAEEEES